MFFLIGVIIFILFVILFYFIIKLKIRSVLDKAGFVGMNLSDIIEEAKLEEQETPKSLASMDRIYLKQIHKDFPEINVSQLKRKAEEILTECFHYKDDSKIKLNGKIKSFVDSIRGEYQNFKIHNTVISNYHKSNGTASIYFSTAFEYYMDKNGKLTKIQDRVKTEFVYIIDESKIDKDVNVLGIHCPNCGSPITTLGEKKCSYCGSAVTEVIPKVFHCIDIVRY
jgi:hypothetical protein